jgi:hypothetical protein
MAALLKNTLTQATLARPAADTTDVALRLLQILSHHAAQDRHPQAASNTARQSPTAAASLWCRASVLVALANRERE